MRNGSRLAGLAPRLACAGLLACSLGAGGCLASYTVDVRNNSTRTVTAELVHDRLALDDNVLASAQLPPGGQKVLGPVRADLFDRVALRVRRDSSVGDLPMRYRLDYGRSTGYIENGGVESWSEIVVRVEKD